MNLYFLHLAIIPLLFDCLLVEKCMLSLYKSITLALWMYNALGVMLCILTVKSFASLHVLESALAYTAWKEKYSFLHFLSGHKSFKDYMKTTETLFTMYTNTTTHLHSPL